MDFNSTLRIFRRSHFDPIQWWFGVDGRKEEKKCAKHHDMALVELTEYMNHIHAWLGGFNSFYSL